MIIKKFFIYLKNYIENTYFLSIFLLNPIANKSWKKQTYSKSHINKSGENYHDKFFNFQGRKIIWELEKKIILNFIKKLNKDNCLSHLDFASGSGRIAILLKNIFQDQYLVDISKSMLDRSRVDLPNAKIINQDFRNENLLQDKKFDLITAFRFFPNAEPALRNEAFKYLSDHLKSNGHILINNHRNFWSIPLFFKRLTFRSDGFGMTHKEIKHLVEFYNLKILDYFSIGVLTSKEKSKYFYPWIIIDKVENFILRIFNSNHKFGYNVIYVIKKNV